MNFLNKIKKLDGVDEAKYSCSTLSLTVYYLLGTDLELLKLLITYHINRSTLHQSIEKINLISIDENRKRST